MEVAKWFSNRFAKAFKKTPVVWCGKVDPRDIVAYITDIEEEEFIVKIGTVTDIAQVS